MDLISLAPLELKVSLLALAMNTGVAVLTPDSSTTVIHPVFAPGPSLSTGTPAAFNGGTSLIAASNSPLPKEPITISMPTPKRRPATALSTATARKSVATVYPESQYEAWFAQYAGQFGVDKEHLKKIAYCESHYNPGAQNGLYGGMYQYSASTWQSTRQQMGADPNPDLRFDAEQAILTSAFKIAAGGIGAWPVCAFK